MWTRELFTCRLECSPSTDSRQPPTNSSIFVLTNVSRGFSFLPTSSSLNKSARLIYFFFLHYTTLYYTNGLVIVAPRSKIVTGRGKRSSRKRGFAVKIGGLCLYRRYVATLVGINTRVSCLEESKTMIMIRRRPAKTMFFVFFFTLPILTWLGGSWVQGTAL
jgi:hypothetical protein